MKYRLQISIELPENLYSTVEEIQKKLEGVSPLIKSIPVDQIQLVLNNLGLIEEQRLPGLTKKLSETIEQFSSINIQPYFISTLYKRHDPSCIYLEPVGDIAQIKEIQKNISQQLSLLSLPSQNKFSALFPLAEINKQDPTTVKQVLDKIQNFEIQPLDVIHVTHVSLYQAVSKLDISNTKKIGEFTLE